MSSVRRTALPCERETTTVAVASPTFVATVCASGAASTRSAAVRFCDVPSSFQGSATTTPMPTAATTAAAAASMPA